MLKFDPELNLNNDGGVVASGPVDPKEEIVELCAWVFQRRDSDAAATEMTHNAQHLLKGEHLGKGMGELEVGTDHWSMELAQVGEGEPLDEGEAFAVAVAMTSENGKQRVVWWGHPVKLTR